MPAARFYISCNQLIYDRAVCVWEAEGKNVWFVQMKAWSGHKCFYKHNLESNPTEFKVVNLLCESKASGLVFSAVVLYLNNHVLVIRGFPITQAAIDNDL